MFILSTHTIMEEYKATTFSHNGRPSMLLFRSSYGLQQFPGLIIKKASNCRSLYLYFGMNLRFIIPNFKSISKSLISITFHPRKFDQLVESLHGVCSAYASGAGLDMGRQVGQILYVLDRTKLS